MQAKAKMCVLFAAAGLGVLGSESHGFVGVLSRLAAAGLSSHATEAPATQKGEKLLKNPGSFITVRRASGAAEEPDARGGTVRISMPSWEGTAPQVASVEPSIEHAIEVPSNARAGDPAYAAAEPDEEDWYYAEDGETTIYGPHGMIFADGVELGYSTLRGHAPIQRRRGHHPRHDVPEFGSSDLHRSAQLKFAEAAQPRLAEQEEGFSRAQRAFHRATLTPGVRRESDGLRHERTPSRQRPRTRW